jgi:chorismate dehydratase
MEKIRISAVRYANTYPFIYGLTVSGFDKKAVIETDHPADCSEKLISGQSDLGLIPVATLLSLEKYYIISNYCIGADGPVRSILLLSDSELKDINTVYLDYRSRTSVNLVKVLAKFKWSKEFRWMDTSAKFDFKGLGNREAAVLIGDQCFEYENNYKYKYDLADEWKKFTGLPFVFACWTANKILPDDFIDEFNSALTVGVENIDKVVEHFKYVSILPDTDLKKYLTEYIDFRLTEEKKKAMELSLGFLRKLESY